MPVGHDTPFRLEGVALLGDRVFDVGVTTGGAVGQPVLTPPIPLTFITATQRFRVLVERVEQLEARVADIERRLAQIEAPIPWWRRWWGGAQQLLQRLRGRFHP